MNPPQLVKNTTTTAPHEDILVIPRSEAFMHEQPWHGISSKNINSFLQTVAHKKEFLPRALMEQDPRYKQIIPYLIFTHGNRYFLMQRKATASEQRLKNKFSLGIGGHVRSEDVAGNDSLFDWARREFHEEINYSGTFSITTLGLLNDDSNPVGEVHIGLVLLLQGDSADISIKSELKSGFLATVDECTQHYDSMESWSQLVFDFLQKDK